MQLSKILFRLELRPKIYIPYFMSPNKNISSSVLYDIRVLYRVSMYVTSSSSTTFIRYLLKTSSS